MLFKRFETIMGNILVKAFHNMHHQYFAIYTKFTWNNLSYKLYIQWQIKIHELSSDAILEYDLFIKFNLFIKWSLLKCYIIEFSIFFFMWASVDVTKITFQVNKWHNDFWNV